MRKKRRRHPDTVEHSFTCAFCGEICTKLIYRSSQKSGLIGKYCNKACNIADMKKKSFSFECIICSKEVWTQPAQVKYRERKTCSMECRSVLFRQRAEERRSGYTKHQLDRLARYSPEIKVWREAVFARDDYTCQICRVRGGYMEADHILPFAYFPRFRTLIQNGRTLCRRCHDKTKISAKAMQQKWLQEKNYQK